MLALTEKQQWNSSRCAHLREKRETAVQRRPAFNHVKTIARWAFSFSAWQLSLFIFKVGCWALFYVLVDLKLIQIFFCVCVFRRLVLGLDFRERFASRGEANSMEGIWGSVLTHLVFCYGIGETFFSWGHPESCLCSSEFLCFS